LGAGWVDAPPVGGRSVAGVAERSTVITDVRRLDISGGVSMGNENDSFACLSLTSGRIPDLSAVVIADRGHARMSVELAGLFRGVGEGDREVQVPCRGIALVDSRLEVIDRAP